jgi:DNA-directed RNA polymerase specialized sigma24 family protein
VQTEASQKRVPTREESFTVFVREIQDRLRHALVAGHGPELGREVAADALSYAWEHWERIEVMENPAGYLYRVGQRLAKRPRSETLFPAPASDPQPWIEPALPTVLASLTQRQRVAVVLVHGYGFTHQETSDLLGVSRGSVQRHLDRGLAKLRNSMGVSND